MDFPRLMWHLWLRNRAEGERWGPGDNGGCVGDGREGVKNQNVEDISSQQIDTGPLIPGFFFSFLLDMICIANGGFCRSGLFWSQKR